MKVFIVRAQGLGYLLEHIYDSRPSKEVLKKVLADELVAHGIKNGEPRERWVRVEEIDVHEGDDSDVREVKGTISSKALAAAKAERERMTIAAGDVGALEIGFSGTGTVTNPE